MRLRRGAGAEHVVVVMRVLGIESSCDETAAAVVTEDGDVISDVVESQLATHAPYGGVVPELAARDHVKNIVPVVLEALRRAETTVAAVDGIAVTTRPGLAGALLVGAQVAKTLAFVAEKPLVSVDHLVGHLLAVMLRRDGVVSSRPELPYVALLASGGHTAIYRVSALDETGVTELGATRDDAAGEAFDKVAKLLRLGYPGGPIVDRLAAKGNPHALRIPLPMLASREMSFSGIKSWVARHVEKNGVPEGDALADLCASFQHAVVTVLAKKTVRAAKEERVRDVVLGGGVAANRGLRAVATELCDREGLRLHVPPAASCTDNAAMIAYAGALRLARGERDDLATPTKTRTGLTRATRKGRGRR